VVLSPPCALRSEGFFIRDSSTYFVFYEGGPPARSNSSGESLRFLVHHLLGQEQPFLQEIQMQQDRFYILYSPSEAAENAGAGFWSAEDGWSGFDSAMPYSAGLRGVLSFPKSLRRDAGWILVGSILEMSLAKEFSTNAETACRFDNLADRYGDVVLASRGDAFDSLEIQGVREDHQPRSESGSYMEVDNVSPQAYSVYARLKRDGDNCGVECIGDFASHTNATTYAAELAAMHAWSVHDYVPEAARTPRWIPSVSVQDVGNLAWHGQVDITART